MNAASRVMQSYGRCCASTSFLDTFYENFLASSPAIRDRFVNTDMIAQRHLLRAGILNLVLFARGMPDTKLRALGESHSRAGLDIRPELYDMWLEALIRAVKSHDGDVNNEDISAWREVMGKGISLIKSYY